MSSIARLLSLFTAGLLAGFAVVSAAAQESQEERRACQPDVVRLCREFIPNVDQINTCLLAKKAELSPECRTVMFGEETQAPPVATPVKAPVKPAKKVAKKKPRHKHHHHHRRHHHHHCDDDDD